MRESLDVDYEQDQGCRLPRALERVGIKRHIRFHDLRHTCASHLLQGTWAPKLIRGPLRLEEVKAWLDHSDIGVTQRYAHLAPDAIRGKVVSATIDEPTVTLGPMNFEIGPQTGAIFGI